MKKILLMCILAGSATVAQGAESQAEHHARHGAVHHVKHHHKIEHVHHHKAARREAVHPHLAKHHAHFAPRVAEQEVKNLNEPDRVATKYDTELAEFQPASTPKLASKPS